MTKHSGPLGQDGAELRADCGRCAGLCCVVPAFAKSSDFAITKQAGMPCRNLTADFRCGIHARLRDHGFAGCTTYDCFGAGQQVVQVTFGGRDWREDPALAAPMFAVYGVMRDLHELRWHLTAAVDFSPAGEIRVELRAALDETTGLTETSADSLAVHDVAGLWRRVDDLLVRASEQARAGHLSVDRRRADLAGADLRGSDLRGANLRGCLLIGADLRAADLRTADVIGADLRGADLRGADLTGALFLTRSQLASAQTDAGTQL